MPRGTLSMPDTKTDVRLSFLAWLAEEDQERQARYVAYREFYDGDHNTQLTARQRRYLQVKMGEDFVDNYCPIVVDALAERLKVTGFDTGDSDQGKLFWDWWQAGRMDGVQIVAHTGAVRDGDTYIITEWQEEPALPIWNINLAYDGTEGVKVHYSKDRRNLIAYASKRWRVESEDPENAGKMRRLNLYYPDRIEKWVSHDQAFEGAWQPFEEEGRAWPEPWVGKDGQPLGVPVAHFKNAEQGYNYGISELKNIIPLQNALNKSIIDLLAAADTTGFRMYWAVGDNPSGLEIAPGSWFYSLNPEAKLGFFPGEDLAPLIAVKDTFVAEIARVSRTPLSYFQASGQVAAEGTQKQQESGLVAKVKDRQVSFGNAWEDALTMARRLHNTYGPGGLDEEQVVSALWADPETRNEREHLGGLKLKAELGVPSEQLWREMGYDEEKVAEMLAMRGAEVESTANLGGELLRAFEGGR